LYVQVFKDVIDGNGGVLPLISTPETNPSANDLS
jgi:hypothetical protein